MLDTPLQPYVSGIEHIAAEGAAILIERGPEMATETTAAENTAQGEPAPDAQGKKQNKYLKAFVDLICDILLPVVCMFVVSGVLKGIMVLCTSLGVLTSEDGTYLIMWALADGIIYFLPMMLAYTCSQRFNCNIFASMAVAGAMLYPTITAAADSGTALTFLGLPVSLVNYGYTILPIIFAVAVLAFLEHQIDKVMPESVKAFFTPLIACAIVVPLTFLVIGPIMNALSDGMAFVCNSFYNLTPAGAGALIGFFWHILTLFGLHLATFPVILANIDSYGFDTICPMVGMALASQAGACLAVFLKSKNTKTKGVSSAATISALLGSTEVCVFGVTFQLKRPFWIANIVAGVFGAAVGILGTTSPSLIAPGVETIIAFYGPTFLAYCGLYAGCFVVTTVLTFLFGYTKKMDEQDLRVDN